MKKIGGLLISVAVLAACGGGGAVSPDYSASPPHRPRQARPRGPCRPIPCPLSGKQS